MEGIVARQQETRLPSPGASFLRVTCLAVAGVLMGVVAPRATAQTLQNDFQLFDVPYFENTAKAIPASAGCPNGHIAVMAGQTVAWDTGTALARPLFDANGNTDTTSATQSVTLPRGGPTRAIATDNQIVRQKDGSLLAIRNSSVWDAFTNNPPAWANELISGVGNHRGQRGSIHVYRSTDCGQTWALYSVIDFGTFLNGRYGFPMPTDDAGNVIADPSTTRQGRYPDGSLKWFMGGGDRTELYACPFSGYVFLATGVTSGPYKDIAPRRVTTLLLYSRDFGRTWELIKEDFNQNWEPLVMTSTPNSRLFLFQIIGNQPIVYYSLAPVTSQTPPRISPPYPVNYIENGRPVPNTTVIPPARTSEIVDLFLQLNHPTISRVSTDARSSRVRAAYHSVNADGMQESRIVLIDVRNPDEPPVVTPLKVVSAEDERDYSVLFFNFIDPDYVDMPRDVKSSASVAYWIEAPRVGIPDERYAIRYMVFNGDSDTSCPGYLSVRNYQPRTWSTRRNLGDYMTGGFFWKNSTLNYLGQWVEPMGMRANIVTLPYNPEQLLSATGKVSILQVHDVGACFGRANDPTDVEVIVGLSSQPGKAFGFQLRPDGNQDERQGMLDLLRSAFHKDRTVRIDYRQSLLNATVIRVEELE